MPQTNQALEVLVPDSSMMKQRRLAKIATRI
jgi:hypothetical protein